MYGSSIGFPSVGLGAFAGGTTLAMTGAASTPVLVALALTLLVAGGALLRLAHLRRDPLP